MKAARIHNQLTTADNKKIIIFLGQIAFILQTKYPPLMRYTREYIFSDFSCF